MIIYNTTDVMRQFFYALCFWAYFFLFLGLILHKAQNGFKYIILLLVFIVLAYPYYKFVRYLSRLSIYIIRGVKIRLTPKHKLLILLIILLVALTPVELIMRMNGYYNIHNSDTQRLVTNAFQPYVQDRLVPNSDPSIHIDSYGFRGDEITKVKPENVYRIVVFGGSTAYGVGVSYDDLVTKILQDMLLKHYHRKIEVLNAGVTGYNSENSIIDYMFRVSDFKPNLVIMWHGINDMYVSCPNYPNILNRNFEPDYSSYTGPLYTMVQYYFFPPIISVNLDVLNYVWSVIATHEYTTVFPYLTNWVSNWVLTYRVAHSPAINQQWPSIASYQRNLRYFIAIVRSDNIPLILGNQPNMFSTYAKYYPGAVKDEITCYNGKTYANWSSQTQGITAFNEVTKKVALENHVQFIDLDALLPRTPTYFLDTIHWSPEGQLVAAKALYNLIVNENYINQK